MNLDQLITGGRGDATTLRDWYRAHPVSSDRLRHTLAHVARRVREGEDVFFAVREFLDEFSIRDQHQRQSAIDEQPVPTDNPRADAFVAGLAEHLVWHHHMKLPSWPNEPERFLDRFWFVAGAKGFRAILIAHSPAAFRRRGIFIHPDALVRY